MHRASLVQFGGCDGSLPSLTPVNRYSHALFDAFRGLLIIVRMVRNVRLYGFA